MQERREIRVQPWAKKIPWSRKWQPMPVFLPGKFHGQRSLAGYSPWGCKVGHNQAHKQSTQWRLGKFGDLPNIIQLGSDGGEGNGTPLQYCCPENPMDGGAWWAVHGVAKSQTRLSDFTFTFHFHALEKEMATHSSVLAWRIPWTEKPGRLQSMGLHKVGHDWRDLAAGSDGTWTGHVRSFQVSKWPVKPSSKNGSGSESLTTHYHK